MTGRPTPTAVDIARALANQEFLRASDMAREALGQPFAAAAPLDTLKLRMDLAVARTRLGDTGEARRELERCLRESSPALNPPMRAELLLRIADIVRLQADAAASAAERQAKAEEALGLYRQGLSLDPDRVDETIRAAAVSLTLGSAAAIAGAREMAGHVLALTAGAAVVDVEHTRRRADALAILGRVDEAARAYESLAALGATTAGLADARFEAALIAAAIGQPRDLFKPAFPPLDLIVFAGHLPDRPGDPIRFPDDAVAAARDAIARILSDRQARVGLASAAAGADLLFVEALAAREGSVVHLVLPWSRDEFRRTSVTPFESAGSPAWGEVFTRALDRAATVREIGQVFEPGGDAGWQYANEVTAGIALHMARASRLDLQPLVFWNGQPGRGEGGTAAFQDLWRRQLGMAPIVVPPPALAGVLVVAETPPPRRIERSTLHQEVKSMLFADIVGYSRLTERAMPEFVQSFLGRVSELIASSRHAPCHVNTWGDALYAVFDFARDAGLFALDLSTLVADHQSDWIDSGLYWEERGPGMGSGEPKKRPLSLRIGLHAGPVVMHHEPITRRIGFTGAHVTRAARIEPRTEPGAIYASEEFAALVALDAARARAGGPRGASPTREFACHFAGTMTLAKDFPGRHHLYRVQPVTVLGIEGLAKAIHAQYCDERRASGETVWQNAALVPWDELPEDLRDANRAQAADIPFKLRQLGWELTAGPGQPPSAITITPELLEALAVREHDRWMAERRRQGWTYNAVRDNARRHHNLLVPWSALPEAEREKDRAAVRHLPRLIELAGLKVK